MTLANEDLYPSDLAFLAALEPDVRAKFEQYIKELDEESAKRDFPYGPGSLVRATGVECWFSYFEDGYSAVAAFDEDSTYD